MNFNCFTYCVVECKCCMFPQIPAVWGRRVAGGWTSRGGGAGRTRRRVPAGPAEDQQAGCSEVRLEEELVEGDLTWSLSTFILPVCLLSASLQFSTQEVGAGGEASVGRRDGVGHVQQAGGHRSFWPTGHPGAGLQDQQSAGAWSSAGRGGSQCISGNLLRWICVLTWTAWVKCSFLFLEAARPFSVSSLGLLTFVKNF